ncbi:MAG TPA: hypothetical protein VHM24_07165, partial [Gemmatimonadaceae bacterium]|nr:hypothetical protein [Gemmatimonadaceae bacterium]
GPYFLPAIPYDAEAVGKNWKDPTAAAEILGAVREVLADAEWAPATLEPALRELAEARGLGAGKLFQPLRVALTGLSVSPGIFEVLEMQGRPLALQRIDQAVEWLRSHT